MFLMTAGVAGPAGATSMHATTSKIFSDASAAAG